MNSLLRILNTLLLAGILATAVLILLHIGQPLAVKQPIVVNGPHPDYWDIQNVQPIKVSIDDTTPVHVEIER